MNSLRRSSWLRTIFCLGGLLLSHFLLLSKALAAEANVDIEPTQFNPDIVTIRTNDSVIWTWVSDQHDSLSIDLFWNSGIHDTGYIFTNTFTTAGTFPYYCSIHGFNGTVI